jgi:polar amino acid transport system substrate-binding protein
VLSKDNPELADAVKQALDYMIDSGSYGEILKKWNVPNAAVEETVMNGATEG